MKAPTFKEFYVNISKSSKEAIKHLVLMTRDLSFKLKLKAEGESENCKLELLRVNSVLFVS